MIRLDGECGQHTAPSDRSVLNADARLANLLGSIGEREEIMASRQAGYGGGHGRPVERASDPPDQFLEEGGSARRELIPIATRKGIVPGMERGGHLLDAQNVNVGRQDPVERVGQGGGREGGRGVKVCHLAFGMNAVVGASGPEEPRLITELASDGGKDLPGDGAALRLYLPPGVARALVLDQQPEVARRLSPSTGSRRAPGGRPPLRERADGPVVQRGTIARTRAGPPDPWLIFIGPTKIVKPLAGSRSRLFRFSTAYRPPPSRT